MTIFLLELHLDREANFADDCEPRFREKPMQVTHELLWFFLISGFILARIGEFRLHKLNFGFFEAMGVEELIPRLMRWYYRLPFLLLPFALIEHFFWDARHSSAHYFLGMVMVLSGVFLRIWTIRSLGRAWCMRCIAFPGIVRVDFGPYRLFAHPEYLSRTIEGMGLFIFGTAFVSAAIYGALSAIAAWKIGAVEQRQLSEYTSNFSASRRRDYAAHLQNK
jgi:methyltransferase